MAHEGIKAEAGLKTGCLLVWCGLRVRFLPLLSELFSFWWYYPQLSLWATSGRCSAAGNMGGIVNGIQDGHPDDQLHDVLEGKMLLAIDTSHT